MKRTRHLLLTMLLLGCTAGLFAQVVEKTLVRSFNLQGADQVTLQLDGPVEVQTWSQSILRIQMQVTLDRGSEAMIRSLVQAGRYNLQSLLQEGAFQIVAPGLEREVLINGTPLGEHISFIVYAPEKVQVEIDDSTSASADHFTEF